MSTAPMITTITPATTHKITHTGSRAKAPGRGVAQRLGSCDCVCGTNMRGDDGADGGDCGATDGLVACGVTAGGTAAGLAILFNSAATGLGVALEAALGAGAAAGAADADADACSTARAERAAAANFS